MMAGQIVWFVLGIVILLIPGDVTSNYLALLACVCISEAYRANERLIKVEKRVNELAGRESVEEVD